MRKVRFSPQINRVITIIFPLLYLFSDVLAQTNNVCTIKNNYILKPFDGPLTNPHKGFCVPSTNSWCLTSQWEYGPGGSRDNQAWNVISHGSGYIRWDVLHTQRGVYDWSTLENVLSAHEKSGLGYGLRVFPYSSSKGAKNNYSIESDYDWTPKFVYEQGAKKTYATITLDGAERTLATPIWDDPIYLQAHKEFAAALAEKYDGDPRIEYIDIRCFGNWGEWHMAHFNGISMPSAEVQKDMLSYYASVFHKTQLVLPSSGKDDVYEHALSLGITKRDDGLIGTPKREETLIPAYEANLPTIGENISTYAIMLTYTDVIPGNYYKWTLDRWKNVINVAHLTYYVLDQDSDAGYRFYNENKAEVDSMTKFIGYNFRIVNADLTTVNDSKTATNTLKITVDNTGVAPCFFDVYMVAELVDDNGNVLSQFGETVFIPKGSFKDGMTKDFEFAYTVPVEQENLAIKQGVSVVLSLYESEEAYKNGKNPTVRFDNEGLMNDNKLKLTSCSHEYGKWDDIIEATKTASGLRRHVCTRQNCESYEEEIIPAGIGSGFADVKKSSDAITSYSVENTIYITNVNGKTVCLYDSKGELYDKKKAKTNELQLMVKNKGVYIVVVDNQQDTIVVK